MLGLSLLVPGLPVSRNHYPLHWGWGEGARDLSSFDSSLPPPISPSLFTNTMRVHLGYTSAQESPVPALQEPMGDRYSINKPQVDVGDLETVSEGSIRSYVWGGGESIASRAALRWSHFQAFRNLSGGQKASERQ